ncbi:DUF488 family protein [Elizabethkingia sp. JS20170427COW]|uniref:DUF488 domain-containing protein n=1 Tax=Elizabethkingia sp. JS20170427COW TaxID=2583851 RepID=UPI001110C490|nr:DUF488 domain-containing protein [Elizabethkingia sp. JS20170427COW]QCX53994.1 DUF488 domain-containing protein [Elizabethkingia sp. JS20170427COW]
MQKYSTIYTIGHSTHTMEEFLTLLQQYDIEVVLDVRSLPGSRKFTWFNREHLEKILPEHKIEYLWCSGLGGRRKFHKDSHNNRWRHSSFRAYADYMETEEFAESIDKCMKLALDKRVAIMCAEALWWRCHRSMISDYLKLKLWKVLHILTKTKIEEHHYTQPAVVRNGQLSYSDGDIFNLEL